MEPEGVQEALDEVAALLDRARSAGIPIIHIQHDDGPGSLYDIEGEERCDAAGGPAQRRAGGREELSELVRAYGPRRSAEDRKRLKPRARRLHDSHVRELHCLQRVQPRLCADGSRRGDRDPRFARIG